MFEEVVNKASQLVKNINLKNCNKLWILFDDNKKPFLGCKSKLTSIHEGKVIDFYNIYFYNLETSRNTKDNTQCDASIYFNSYVNNTDDPSALTDILVSKEFAGKKLGSELLRVLEILIYNNKNLKITGVLIPHDYATDMSDMVKHFYIKNGFKPFISKNNKLISLRYPNLETFENIKKTLSKKDIDTLKKRIVAIPTKDHNFNVIVPSDLIMCSGYVKEKRI